MTTTAGFGLIGWILIFAAIGIARSLLSNKDKKEEEQLINNNKDYSY